MLYGGGLLGLAELCLVVYCFLDVIRTPGNHVRNLPKPVWLILCFIPPILGPIAWLLFGRPNETSPGDMPYKGNRGIGSQPTRPRRAASSPDDDEAFLRSLRERAEQQRRAAEQQRRQRDEGS